VEAQYDFENIPVVDIVNDTILVAIDKGASDIHFDPFGEDLKIRMRVDGELTDYALIPNSIKKNLITRIKIISGMNITESRTPQDGAIKKDMNSTDLDFRVASLPVQKGEKIVIRILDYSMSNAGLENLGFSEYNMPLIKKMIAAPNGIVLITGATGTGKSTTVYSLLAHLNNNERNIITVEDPVEMKIVGINQVQVIADIGLTFGNTLRSILRNDPDIIMIGEIRDSETARIAVRASITGHLVLSTLHTNNSLNTIERLLDMDVERYLLGSALSGIISQRLVKKLCPYCRGTRETNDYEKEVFTKALGLDVKNISTPVGCPKCFKGYSGRTAIQEVLIINEAIRDAIVGNVKKSDLRRLVYDKKSMVTILQDGLNKVVSGLTSFEEIIRIIDLDEDFGSDDDEIKIAIKGRKKPKKEQDVELPKVVKIDDQ